MLPAAGEGNRQSRVYHRSAKQSLLYPPPVCAVVSAAAWLTPLCCVFCAAQSCPTRRPPSLCRPTPTSTPYCKSRCEKRLLHIDTQSIDPSSHSRPSQPVLWQPVSLTCHCHSVARFCGVCCCRRSARRCRPSLPVVKRGCIRVCWHSGQRGTKRWWTRYDRSVPHSCPTTPLPPATLRHLPRLCRSVQVSTAATTTRQRT